MLSVVFVAAFTAVMAGVGWNAVHSLDRQGRLLAGERVIASFAIGCLAAYFLVFAVASVRLDAVAMWGVLSALALASLPGWARMPVAGFVRSAAREVSAARGDPVAAVLWLAVIGVAASSLVQGLAPPNDYDALMYHLVNPQYDLELGRTQIPWERSEPVALMPALGGNLTRIALATMNDGVAQMLHDLFGLVAAAASACLTHRLGFGRRVILASALFFLVIQVVVWQMATVETDVPVAAYGVMALLVYLAWREDGGTRLSILFGLMVGGAIVVKYHGFAIALSLAPLILYDLFIRRRPWTVVAGPAVSFLVIVPHLVRNAVHTANPVYPLFTNLFNPGTRDYLGDVHLQYGTGRGLLDVLTAPWNMFVVPMHHFDGMIFGAPFVLALAPLILLAPRRLVPWLPILGFAAVYYMIWFFLLSQQVRFLLPIMPILATAAAAGAAVAWQATGESRTLRAGLVAVVAVLAVNQSMFVGIYAALRLPVVFGLMDVATYLRTPNLTTSFYDSCRYIRDNLEPGERYYANIIFPSYYCPQQDGTKNPNFCD